MLSDVSQPLLGLPSQLPHPAAQFGVQAPDVHDVVPFALVHAVPHAPQLEVVVSGVSQPSETLPLQLPHPALQEMEQALSEQDGVPWLLLHTLPHAPQLLVSVWRLFSQPLDATPSQLPKPELQVPSVQVPVEHDSLAFARSHT